jgi:hypothetical protein
LIHQRRHTRCQSKCGQDGGAGERAAGVGMQAVSGGQVALVR